MNTPLYMWIDGKIIQTDDVSIWSAYLRTDERVIVKTQVGEVEISTIFLTLDHSFGTGGEPILFETMIFGGEYDQEMWRYTTEDKARQGHELAVALVRGDEDSERTAG